MSGLGGVGLAALKFFHLDTVPLMILRSTGLGLEIVEAERQRRMIPWQPGRG